jgi:hypothetical protein
MQRGFLNHLGHHARQMRRDRDGCVLFNGMFGADGGSLLKPIGALKEAASKRCRNLDVVAHGCSVPVGSDNLSSSSAAAKASLAVLQARGAGCAALEVRDAAAEVDDPAEVDDAVEVGDAVDDEDALLPPLQRQ